MLMFEKEHLTQWAGSAAFGRGEDYFRRRLVDELEISASSAEATVLGTYPYQVQLRWRGDFLQSDCDCPVGERTEFCKHCVAVALAWLESGKAGTKDTKKADPESSEMRLRRWLEGQEAGELVALIMGMAGRHRNMEKELLLKAAIGSTDLKTLKQTIRKAIGNGFVDYHEMPAYGRRIAAVSDLLEQMLADDHAAEVQSLALYAVDRIKDAYNNMDDSDGITGSEMEYWQALHLQACEAVPPASAQAKVALARDLFERELNSDWGEFYGAVQSYGKVLGDDGVAEYRRLIEAEWEKLPELTAADNEKSFDGNRWKISSMMESLAKASGDVDELIRIKSRDLSSSNDFLQIAKIYREVERYDEALAWAEKGVAAFAKDYNPNLEEFLISEYVRREQFDKAVALAWTMFEKMPSLQAWQRLKAQVLGVGNWQEWKSWALDYVRDDITRKKKKHGASRYYRPDHSLLVELFLDEGEAEAAWQEADKGGCSNALWRRLGKTLANIDPIRSAKCWMRLVEPTIDRKSNSAYDDAVRMMLQTGQWMDIADRHIEFADWIMQIRVRHKPKRNLMRRMNEQNLGGQL